MKKEITVTSTSVYDPRALAELVGLANGYASKVIMVMDNRSVNAKSIRGIMGLGLDQGKQVTLDVEGTDAEEAIVAIEEFLNK